MKVLEKVERRYHNQIYHGTMEIIAFVAYQEYDDIVKSFELARDDIGELWFVATWWYESDGTKHDIHQNVVPKGEMYRLPHRAPPHYRLSHMPKHLRHLILEHFPWSYLKKGVD